MKVGIFFLQCHEGTKSQIFYGKFISTVNLSKTFGTLWKSKGYSELCY